MTPIAPTTETPTTGPTPGTPGADRTPHASPLLQPLTEEQRAAAVAMLKRWREAGPDQSQDDDYDLCRELDANRGPGQRKLFVPNGEGDPR